MNKKNKGFTTIELITSFTLASVIMIILFNIILILKDNLSKVNAKTNMLVEKDNLSYNINKRFKEKELSSITMCDEGDKCYLFTYSDDTSDKLVYSNTDKSITFNNYTFDIIDGITVEEPIIKEYYDTMSSTKYNGYFIIHIPIKLDNKDYSIKINKHFNTDSFVIDLRKSVFDKSGNRYVLVEYLESTGTQYIDTNIVPIYNKIEVDAVMSTNGNDYSETGRYAFFGMWTNSFNFRLYKPTSGSSGVLRVQYGGPYTDISNISLDDSFLNIKFNYQALIINEVNQNIQIGTNSNSKNTPIYIFTSLSANSGIEWLNYNCHIRCYSFKIYNDTLVRDYIPVIDSTERPCLFDKVSRECYYNQGTGEFLYG